MTVGAQLWCQSDTTLPGRKFLVVLFGRKSGPVQEVDRQWSHSILSVAQQEGSQLCASKTAGVDLKKPIAKKVPLSGSKYKNFIKELKEQNNRVDLQRN